jgi:hypothetical protein
LFGARAYDVVDWVSGLMLCIIHSWVLLSYVEHHADGEKGGTSIRAANRCSSVASSIDSDNDSSSTARNSIDDALARGFPGSGGGSFHRTFISDQFLIASARRSNARP